MYVSQESSGEGQASLEIEVGGPSGAISANYGPLFRRDFLTNFNGPIARTVWKLRKPILPGTKTKTRCHTLTFTVHLSVLAKRHTEKSNVALVTF
jgi:hypothetical protein